MKHFKPQEFREFYNLMNAETLMKFDELRELSGFKMIVSPADGAIGRETGAGWHNFKKHGEIYACDFFVSCDNKPLSQMQALHFRDCAVSAGLRGIGLYPHWTGPVGTGFHIDNRSYLTNRFGRKYDQWGALYQKIDGKRKQVYTSFEKALLSM